MIMVLSTVNNKININIVRLTSDTFAEYIPVGTKSYIQHYLHLWENNDPEPYMESSFTTAVLNRELEDTNTDLFIIRKKNAPVGILKLIKNQRVGSYVSEEAILLEKIYLLKEHSGKGIGNEVLRFVEEYGRQLSKKVLWLDTMKKGPALQFYLNKGFQILKEKQLEFGGVLEDEKPMYILIKSL